MNNITDGDCEHQMFSGIEQRAIIINKADIKSVDTDMRNPRIVTKINFRDNKNAYGIINARNNPYQGTNTTVEVGDYKNTFTRTVSLFVPMDGAEASQKVLDPLANGKFVVIMQNQYVNEIGDNEFQIYGIDKGLVVSSMTQTKYENNDYWVVELQESGVPNSGRFLIHEEEKTLENASGMLENNGEGMFTGSFTYEVQNAGVTETVTVDGISVPINSWTEYDEANHYYYVDVVKDGVTYRLYMRTGETVSEQYTITNATLVSNTADYFYELVPDCEPEP